MAGTPPSAADVNNLVGSIARDIDMTLARVQIMQAWLLTVDLTAAPYSMLAADQATIKSAFSDLDQLRTLYQGAATLAAAKNFRTFAAQLHGPSL
jgi:hypothetical protein